MTGPGIWFQGAIVTEQDGSQCIIGLPRTLVTSTEPVVVVGVPRTTKQWRALSFHVSQLSDMVRIHDLRTGPWSVFQTLDGLDLRVNPGTPIPAGMVAGAPLHWGRTLEPGDELRVLVSL